MDCTKAQALVRSYLETLDVGRSGQLDRVRLFDALQQVGLTAGDLEKAVLSAEARTESQSIDYVKLLQWIFGEPPRSPETSGVPLETILTLVTENQAWLESTKWNERAGKMQLPTMYDIVKHIVKPRTAKRRCSFAELYDPMAPHVFVSHWWGEEFVRFVRSLSCFAKLYAERRVSLSPGGVVFWICSLANRQWEVNLGKVLEESPFELALQSTSCDTVLMVMDQAVTPLRRIWCLYEVLRSHALGKSFHIGTEHGALTFGSREVQDELRMELVNLSQATMEIDASSAQASKESDRQMILHAVEQQAGLEQFTLHVKSLLAVAFNRRGGEGLAVQNPTLKLELMMLQKKSKALVTFTGRTALHVASQRGSINEVRECLRTASDGVNATNGLGQTALHLAACFSGCKEVLQMLIEARADVHLEDKNEFAPWMIAAFGGQVESLQFFFDTCADVDFDALIADGFCKLGAGQMPKSPLTLAAFGGNLDCIEFLLSRGVQIDPFAMLMFAMSSHYIGLELLLKCRANPNDTLASSKFPTCLLAACRGGDSQCVSLLLEARADVHAKSMMSEKQASTPFVGAASVGHIEIMRLLMRHSADPLEEMERGNSAFMLACGSGSVDCVQLLLDLRADPSHRNTPTENEDCYTVLHNAANWGRNAVARVLVKARADVHARDNSLRTPLHHAAMFGYCETIRTLLTLRANLDDVDDAGMRPYELALSEEEPEAAAFLLELMESGTQEVQAKT